MKLLTKPKNDWAKVLWILNQTFDTGTSMAKVLRDWDMFFYKFQARLIEVEKEYPTLNIKRETLVYESKVNGRKKHYTHYKVGCSKSYLLDLFHKINDNGFKGKTHKPEESNEPANLI